jgi:hypothetical protein
MKKNPFLLVFTAFLLVSASLGVSSAKAAPGDNKQFCFLEKTVDGKPRLEFRQKTDTETIVTGEKCFDSWFGDGVSMDAYTYLSNWLSNTANAEGSIYLTSDIVFAGYDSGTGDCVVGPNAFKGKMLNLKVGQTLTGGTSFHTITGLCHISSEEKVGFVQLYGKMEYLNFNQAYFKSTATKSRVGIVPVGGNTTQGNIISHCRVEHSKFFGIYVGALLGEGISQFESIELNDVSVEGLSVGTEEFYIGGIAGGIVAVEKNAGSLFSTGYYIKDIILDNVSLTAPDPNGHEINIGGIAGSIALKLKSSFSDISISDLTIEKGSLDGGVFGRMSYDGSENPSGNEHKVSLENISIGGNIESLENAGGLAGQIDGGSLPGAVEIRKIASNTKISVIGSDAKLTGGLVASVQHSSTNKMNLDIRYTYSIGDINGVDSYKSGYLIGYLEIGKFNFKNISDNYHYGASDDVTKRGIGIFPDVGWKYPLGCLEADCSAPPEFKAAISGSVVDIKRNFRNSLTGIGPDGWLTYDFDAPIQLTTEYDANGVIDITEMKSRFLAAVMNHDEAVWTQVDSENDGFPMFASASNKPIYPMVFDKASFDAKADASHKELFEKALTDIGGSLSMAERAYGACPGDDCYALFTDNTGKLIESEVDALNGFVETDGIWKNVGGKKLVASTVYDNANEIYSYEKSSTLMTFEIVNHFCLDDGSGACESGTDKEIPEKNGVAMLNGYKYGYMLAPVNKFKSNESNVLVPPLMISGGGNESSILPTAYKVKGKKTTVTEKTDKISSGIKRFDDLFSYVKDLDYDDYETTIHLYYMDAANSEIVDINNDNADISIAVKGFGYDVDGTWSKPISQIKVDANATVNVPLARGFTVEMKDVGYQFDGWMVEFGKTSEFTSSSVIHASKKYLMTPSEFTSHYKDRVWVLQNLSANDTVYMDSIYRGLSFVGDASSDFMMRISPSVTPIDYEVTFDFESVTTGNPLIVFGDSWASSLKRTMNLSETERVFPRSYIYSTSDEKFYPMLWSHQTQDKFNFSVDLISTVAFNNLTSKLLENALGGDKNAVGFTLYPINPKGEIGYDIKPSPINIYAIDDDGNKLTAADDYHGRIVLSQTVGTTTIQQKSKLFYSSTTGYRHVLYLPGAASDDTLTFDVSFEPEPGYTIVIKKYNNTWTTAPAGEFWGYDADTKKLRISTKNMSPSSFEIQYKPNEHYNMEFTIPESMRNKDVFVANKKTAAGKYEPDWFTKQENVTVETVKAPKLYNSDGCRIYWKPENESKKTFDIKDELQYMVSIETQSGFVNTLVPDIDNPDCPVGSVTPTTQRVELSRSGDGELTLKQRLSYEPQVPGDPDFIEITHSFKEDASGNLYLDLPRIIDGDGNDLGVKFTMEANANDGYAFDVLSYKVGTSSEVLLNGSEFDFMNGLDMAVDFVELKPVYVTYDLSLTSSEDSSKTYLPVRSAATGSLKMEKEKDVVEFWQPFRTDKCFSGWSTIKADVFIKGDPVYTSLDATNYIDFSKDAKAPTKLYAIWYDCAGAAPTPTIVLKNGNEHTTLVLYQEFNSKYLRHEIPDAGISLAGSAFDFFIDETKTVVEAGYSVDFAAYKLSYTYATASGTSNPKDVAQVAGAWQVSTEGIPAVPTYTFASTVSPVEYTVVFNENATGINAKPFFGDSWADYMTKDAFVVDADKNWTVKASYSIESLVKKFPMALYRNGYCMQGYTFDKNDDANGVYNEMNDVFMDKAEMLGKDPAKSIMLYAYWSVCNDGLTIKLEDADKGTYKFTRTFDLGGGEKTPERVYEASTEIIQIPSINEDISVTGMSFVAKNGAGVIVDDQSNFSYRKKSEKDWNEISGNFFSVKADIESIKAPILKNTYEFVYDVNAPQNGAVFVSPTWKKSESYTLDDVSESKELQSIDVMGRTDACLVGWALDEKGDKELHSFDIEALRKLDELAKAGQSVETLYAVWEPKSSGCKPETFTVTSGMMAEQGSFKVTYSFENKVYEFDVGKDGVEIPVIEGVKIAVKFNGTKAYKFGKNVTGVEANGDVAFDIENGKSFTVGHNQKDITLKVEAESVEFHLVFDVSSDDGKFYGSDWTENGKYASVEENTVSFPTMVYDSDRCLAGWSVNSESGTAWTDLNVDLVTALYAAYPDLESASDIKLYAHWTDKVEDCAGNITRATAESKHGEVQFVEKVGKSKVVHKFNKKGTMLLPAEIESDNWTLSVTPDDGYKLDSLVVLRDGKKVAVLHNGDHLPKNMKDVVLKAYFKKNDGTPVDDSPIKIVEKSFDKSGNAIRVIYKTNAFDATRDVFAKVKIVDVAGKKPPVIDTSFSKAIAPSSSNEVVFFMMHPGTFKMLFSIGDGEDSSEFSEEFTIDSQVASLKAKQWTMVSLAAVDTASINWNEDHSFYWWDDSYVGEYWQYHSFNRGDDIVANRGYWFSSWNGGSLAMRENLKDDGKDVVWNLERYQSGWNLVANPHGWSVDLYSLNESALKDVDEESDVRFYRYIPETGGYLEILEDSRYLAPYEAVWAQVSKKTTWKISAEPVFDTASAKPEKRFVGKSALAKASTAERWTLQAVLSDKKGKRDSWNILGVGNNPFVADEPPASMGDHVNLSIVEGKRALAKSIKSASDETEWTINLSASGSREGFLSFAGIDGVKSFGYHVFVTVDGETTEMHEGKPLPVSLNSSKKSATVRVARSARVLAKNVIKGLRSTTVGNQLHVSFDASEGLAGERTKVELLDVKGTVVATVSAKTLSGTNAVTMKQPKMGVYILRVRVGSQQQTQRIMVK